MATNNDMTLSTPGSRRVVNEKEVETVLKEWGDQINDSMTIRKVVLSDKSYTAEAAMKISQFLKQHVKDVTQVDLSDMIAGRPEEEGLKVLTTICDVFQNCALSNVDLSDNAMGSKGLQACQSVIGAQSQTLESLYLNNNGLAKETMKELADIILSKKDLCDNLRELSIYNNMSGDDGAVEMSRILANLKQPTYIRYSGCRALTEGCKALGDGFAAMGVSIQSLQKLDLNGSNFGSGESDDQGVRSLATALQRAKSLKIAILRDCGLESEGTQLICQALHASCAPIQVLDLAENEMTVEAGCSTAFLSLLKRIAPTTLHQLELQENELTSKAIQKIVNVLSASKTSPLKILSLDLNEVGHIGAKALCAATLPNLETLRLDDNGFSSEDVDQLQAVFGDKLQDMEGNDEDEDFDDQHGLEEEDYDVDAAAEELSKLQM